MKLSSQDAEQYFRLSHLVLCYTNQKLNLHLDIQTPEAMKKLPLDAKVEVRDGLWKNTQLLDSFVKANPYELPDEELEIVGNWKHLIEGRFFLVKYLKNYAIFIQEGGKIAYGVCALRDDFEDVLDPDPPIYLETVLLPFKGKIIYDGIMFPYSISFGPGLRKDISDSYQRAKAKYGIITSLPISVESQKQSDEDLLRFYLKSQTNRDQYWEEIWRLIEKKPALLLLFHQEMGKVNARTYKKRLREAGIDRGWFAILEGLIVASGTTKEEAEKAVKAIVPSEKRSWVYIFRHGK